MTTRLHLVGGTLGEEVDRCVVRVTMTPELLEQALVQSGAWSDHLRVQKGLPPGAKLIHAEFDRIRGLTLSFEHESFAINTVHPHSLDVAIESYRCDHKPNP